MQSLHWVSAVVQQFVGPLEGSAPGFFLYGGFLGVDLASLHLLFFEAPQSFVFLLLADGFNGVAPVFFPLLGLLVEFLPLTHPTFSFDLSLRLARHTAFDAFEFLRPDDRNVFSQLLRHYYTPAQPPQMYTFLSNYGRQMNGSKL